MQYLKDLVKNKPKCKVLISNFGGKLLYFWIDTDCIKEFSGNQTNNWFKYNNMIVGNILFCKGIVESEG